MSSVESDTPWAEVTRPPDVSIGNRLRLLKTGNDYFPILLAAINSAARSVHLETYIFEDDNIGRRISDALAVAADRGVAVRLMIDGFGAAASVALLKARLEPLGAQVLVFSPARWWRPQRGIFRRLHRKVALVDEQLAFVGGINIIDDQNHPEREPGSLGPRFDFAVMCQGPIVATVAVAVTRLWRSVQFRQFRARSRSVLPPPLAAAEPFADGVPAALLLRDNFRNRRTIERAYLEAFEGAEHEVLIANAYFLPGRRFRDALIAVARRGVRVRLLLQGRTEYWLQHYAQLSLYGQLLDAGIEIHEYLASYMHAKAAVVDGRWATVGSSNIDPFSLLVAREANVAVFDERFAQGLRAELDRAIATESRPIGSETLASRGLLQRVIARCAYRLVRLLTVLVAQRDVD